MRKTITKLISPDPSADGQAIIDVELSRAGIWILSCSTPALFVMFRVWRMRHQFEMLRQVVETPVPRGVMAYPMDP